MTAQQLIINLQNMGDTHLWLWVFFLAMGVISQVTRILTAKMNSRFDLGNTIFKSVLLILVGWIPSYGLFPEVIPVPGDWYLWSIVPFAVPAIVLSQGIAVLSDKISKRNRLWELLVGNTFLILATVVAALIMMYPH